MTAIIAIQDDTGVQEHFDVSQIKARGLNHWHGWKCSAGTNSIHICSDGDVWVGTCRVGGKLGNISTGWISPTEWITCSRSYCGCGTEIKLPKHKPGYAEALLAASRTETGQIDPDRQTFVDFLGKSELHVQWDLGRFCNYDCSYCSKGPQGVHNSTDPHKPLDVLMATVERLHVWATGRVMWFCFSGGEPTLHPGFITLCRMIHQLGHKIHLTTNGSHGPRYWKILLPHIDMIQVSVHFEFVNDVMLVNNLLVMLEHRIDNPEFGIAMTIMTKPSDFDRATSLINVLRNAHDGFFNMVEGHLTPLRIMLGVDSKLMSYTPDQIAQFGSIR